MWWIGVISLIVEIIKLLLSLRKERDHPALAFEFEAAKKAYKQTRDKGPLERLRDRLRERRKSA